MKLSDLKVNPDNPRTIKDSRFKKLCNSIRDFPKMMAKRPIVFDSSEGNKILGGNMRYLSLKKLGFTEIPDEWVKDACDFTEDEKRRFIAIDNVEFGEFDMDSLGNQFDASDLVEWGFDEKKLGIDSKEISEESEFYTLNFKFQKDDAAFVQEKLHEDREMNKEKLDEHWRERCLLRILRKTD
jgi:hypothetical protein